MLKEKKKKKSKNTQIHKDLQFPSTSFHILKLLLDSFIINVTKYITFKFQLNIIIQDFFGLKEPNILLRRPKFNFVGLKKIQDGHKFFIFFQDR